MWADVAAGGDGNKMSLLAKVGSIDRAVAYTAIFTIVSLLVGAPRAARSQSVPDFVTLDPFDTAYAGSRRLRRSQLQRHRWLE